MAAFTTLFAASLFALAIGVFTSALFLSWFVIKTTWKFFV